MKMSSYTTPPSAFVTHVWNLPPQGDSRGPYNLHFSCSTTASRTAIINQDLPPVFVFATGFDDTRHGPPSRDEAGIGTFGFSSGKAKPPQAPALVLAEARGRTHGINGKHSPAPPPADLPSRPGKAPADRDGLMCWRAASLC